MKALSSMRFTIVAVLILGLAMFCRSEVSVGVSIRVGPPPLPEYAQPECPAPGHMWIPGYWAYGDDGYYWVPGVWVIAPRPGLLWTPGYWGWSDGVYFWHEGYWARHVGFYGGVNYGFGYTGVGFAGGFWRGGVYRYNRAVTNVNVTVIHNTYNKVVVTNTTNVNRVSFNGGSGGIIARPLPSELVAVHEKHIAATVQQRQNIKEATGNRAFLAAENHGQPYNAALGKHAAAGLGETKGPSAASPEQRPQNDRNIDQEPNNNPKKKWRKRGMD